MEQYEFKNKMTQAQLDRAYEILKKTEEPRLQQEAAERLLELYIARLKENYELMSAVDRRTVPERCWQYFCEVRETWLGGFEWQWSSRGLLPSVEIRSECGEYGVFSHTGNDAFRDLQEGIAPIQLYQPTPHTIEVYWRAKFGDLDPLNAEV